MAREHLRVGQSAIRKRFLMEALAYIYSALTYEQFCCPKSISLEKKSNPVYLDRPPLKKVF